MQPINKSSDKKKKGPGGKPIKTNANTGRLCDSAVEAFESLLENEQDSLKDFEQDIIQKILITLYNHFKKLYLIKLAENENIAEALKLKPNQMFLITKYKKQATYFKKEELRGILQKLIDLDYKSKNGLIDINIGLEAILCF